MALFETYSMRTKGFPDVYQYHSIPLKVRTQIVLAWEEYFNQPYFSQGRVILEWICTEVQKAHGRRLNSFGNLRPITDYFQSRESGEVNDMLDIIEIVFFACKVAEKKFGTQKIGIDEVITEINARFRYAGIGLAFVNGKMMRFDNDLLYQETIKTTLALTSEPYYKNVEDEFMSALEHHRFDRKPECLNECLKAFETTVKLICTKNNWEYDNHKDTAQKLIAILIREKFMPVELYEQQLNSLRQFLESSIPTIRNKKGGHGQGEQKNNVPDYLVSYMLYITGAAIRLLIEIQKAREKQ
jgi:hypothetical protein